MAEEVNASEGLSSLESDWMAVNVNWERCLREAAMVLLDVLHCHLQGKTDKITINLKAEQIRPEIVANEVS